MRTPNKWRRGKEANSTPTVSSSRYLDVGTYKKKVCFEWPATWLSFLIEINTEQYIGCFNKLTSGVAFWMTVNKFIFPHVFTTCELHGVWWTSRCLVVWTRPYSPYILSLAMEQPCLDTNESRGVQVLRLMESVSSCQQNDWLINQLNPCAVMLLAELVHKCCCTRDRDSQRYHKTANTESCFLHLLGCMLVQL